MYLSSLVIYNIYRTSSKITKRKQYCTGANQRWAFTKKMQKSFIQKKIERRWSQQKNFFLFRNLLASCKSFKSFLAIAWLVRSSLYIHTIYNYGQTSDTCSYLFKQIYDKMLFSNNYGKSDILSHYGHAHACLVKHV